MLSKEAAVYAKFWASESERFGNQGLYDKLSLITPNGKVLEFGAGSGLSTVALAADHEVLSLEGNATLLAEVRRRVSSIPRASVIGTDFLDFSVETIESIQNFAPDGIVGWFLGSNGDDHEKYVHGSMSVGDVAKKYREIIEDSILSLALLLPSVEWIHLVSRGGIQPGHTVAEAERAGADDYNEHVFHPNGFEVVSIQTFDWDQSGSEFPYVGSAHDPNEAQGSASIITSMLARRKAG